MHNKNCNIKKMYSESVLFAGILLYSFFLLFFCSTSSPLYYANLSADANVYFTLGKGLFSGLVPYRDLFDNKGPLVYFIYGVGFLISNNSFFGMYILESVSAAFSIYFIYKMVRLFIPVKQAWISIFIYSSFLLNSQVFGQGGAVEELMLPFMAAGFYCFFRIFLKTQTQSVGFKTFFLLGLCTAAMILMKINNATVLFPLIGIAFLMFLVNKQYKTVAIGIIGGLLGAALIATPFLIYLYKTASFFDCYRGYIEFNMSYTSVRFGVGTALALFKNLFRATFEVYPMWVMIIWGIVIFTVSNQYFTCWGRTAFCFSFLLLLFAVYSAEQSYSYYMISFTIFTVFGIIILLDFLAVCWERRIYAYILVLCFFVIPLNKNILYSKLFAAEPSQVKFAKIILESGFADLINYRSHELGVQTAAGIIPSSKYFYRMNISEERFPESFEEQDRIVANSEIPFIVIRGIPDLQKKFPVLYDTLMENYVIVSEIREKIPENALPEYRTLLKAKNSESKKQKEPDLE